jgi:hypothetical protein
MNSPQNLSDAGSSTIEVYKKQAHENIANMQLDHSHLYSKSYVNRRRNPGYVLRMLLLLTQQLVNRFVECFLIIFL